MGNSAKARLYEIITKLFDMKDRIEQSAVLLEQSSLEDNSENDGISEFRLNKKDEHFE